MKLHDAMIEVLRCNGGDWMDRDQIAQEIASGNLYVRRDGLPPSSDQLRLRARHTTYAAYFECSDKAGTQIRLRPGRVSVDSIDTSSRSAVSRIEDDRKSSLEFRSDQIAARKRRVEADERYRPSDIELLLIAEAPPSALDRYFYFEDVREHDSLFRYVVKSVLGREPDRSKGHQLRELRDRGVFLIDLKLDPVDGSSLKDAVPDLLRRVSAIDPGRIILIKASVFDAAYRSIRDAGFPVIDARIPFPGSGQQRRFLDAMTKALAIAGWIP